MSASGYLTETINFLQKILKYQNVKYMDFNIDCTLIMY